MKRYLLIIALIPLCAGLFASDNPMNDYLQDPDIRSFKLAVDHLSKLDSQDPESLSAKLNLAYLSNHFAKVIMDLALDNLDLLSPGEKFSLGNLYLNMEKYDEAVMIYNQLNEASPRWSCPWRHKGEALYRSGNFEDAAQALAMSIETNREHYDAYVWYAMALDKLERYPEALQALQTSFSLSAEEEGSHFDEELPESEIEELYKALQQKVEKK
jgi:tetratricopeptide (TPR) repeat protein